MFWIGLYLSGNKIPLLITKSALSQGFKGLYFEMDTK
jgi:hypothetical protein